MKKIIVFLRENEIGQTMWTVFLFFALLTSIVAPFGLLQMPNEELRAYYARHLGAWLELFSILTVSATASLFSGIGRSFFIILERRKEAAGSAAHKKRPPPIDLKLESRLIHGRGVQRGRIRS